MRIKTTAFIALIALTIASCKKEEETTTEETTTTTTEVVGDYFPLAVDNEWNYEGAMEYKNFIDGTEEIDGETYFNVVNDAGSSSLIRKSGDNYYAIDETTYGDDKPHIILKEAASEGDSWNFEVETSSFGFTTTSKYTFTIHGKLSSMTVGGKTYEDILVIDNDLEVYMEGFLVSSLNDTRYYYSRGIGLIQSDLPTVGTVDLASYTVK